MTIKMKQVGKVKKNCFEIEIEYAHANGWIDFDIVTKQVLDTSSTSELEKFINSFKETSNIISRLRGEAEATPELFTFKSRFKRKLIDGRYIDTIDVPDTSLYVMVIQDHTDNGEAEHILYADMSIRKINFIDENLNIFDIYF